MVPLPENRVSVILPNKGRYQVLERAVASILAQKHENVEIIIVDDSNDELFQQIAEAYGNHHNVKVIRGNKSGDMLARVQGLKAATGEYVSFLDSDDIWAPEKLREHLHIWGENPDITMSFDKWHKEAYSNVYGNLVIATEKYGIIQGNTLRNMLLIHGNFIHMSSIFTKRIYLRSLIQGSATPMPPFDLFLSLHLSKNSKVGYINQLLTEKSDSEDALGKNWNILKKERHSILNMSVSNLLRFRRPPDVSLKFFIWKFLTILAGIPVQPFLGRYTIFITKIERKLIKNGVAH